MTVQPKHKLHKIEKGRLMVFSDQDFLWYTQGVITDVKPVSEIQISIMTDQGGPLLLVSTNQTEEDISGGPWHNITLEPNKNVVDPAEITKPVSLRYNRLRVQVQTSNPVFGDAWRDLKHNESPVTYKFVHDKIKALKALLDAK